MRRPLEHAPFTEVLTRVCYQMVVLDYRARPQAYRDYPPKAAYELAERLRAIGFTNLFWTLNQCARWLASGYTLRAWRDELRPDQQMRAVHKLRGQRAR